MIYSVGNSTSRFPENLREAINHVLERVARQIKCDIEANPEIIDAEEDVDYLDGSTMPVHLRQLLSEVDWYDRATWAELLAMLGQYCGCRFSSLAMEILTPRAAVPHELPNVGAIIAQLAIHDPDDDVQSACYEALLPLVDQGNSYLTPVQTKFDLHPQQIPET